METLLLTKEEILKQYLELSKPIDVVEYEICDGIEIELEDDILVECRGILYDGFGYVIGETSNDGKSHIVKVSMRKLDELTVNDRLKIIDYLGLDSDSIDDICFTDSLIKFVLVDEILFSEV